MVALLPVDQDFSPRHTLKIGEPGSDLFGSHIVDKVPAKGIVPIFQLNFGNPP